MRIAQACFSILFTYPKCCNVVVFSFTLSTSKRKKYTLNSTFLRKATFQQQGADGKSRTGECMYDLLKHPRHHELDGKLTTVLGTDLRIKQAKVGDTASH